MTNNLWTYLLGVIFLALIGTWLICCPLTWNIAYDLSIPLLWTFLTTKFNLSNFLKEFFIIVGALGSFLVAITALSTAKTAEKQVTEMKEQRKLQHDPELVLTSTELVLYTFDGCFKDKFYEFLKNRLVTNNSSEIIQKLNSIKENGLINLYYWGDSESNDFEQYISELEETLCNSFDYIGNVILHNGNELKDIDSSELLDFKEKSFKNATIGLYNIGNGVAKNIKLTWKIDYESLIEYLRNAEGIIDLEYFKISSKSEDPEDLEIINLNSFSNGFESQILLNDLIKSRNSDNSPKFDVLLPANTHNKKSIRLPTNFLKICSESTSKYYIIIKMRDNLKLPVLIEYQDVLGNKLPSKRYDLKINLVGAKPYFFKKGNHEFRYQMFKLEIEAEDVINS